MSETSSDLSDGLSEVVQDGDYRASLEALRDRLATGVEAATGRALVHLAPLSKQLADVLRAIAELPPVEEVNDSVDDSRDATERKLRSVG